jgi:hypothetical protein
MKLEWWLKLPVSILIINLAISLKLIEAPSHVRLNSIDVSGHHTQIYHGSGEMPSLFVVLFCLLTIEQVSL